ncbi:hypothetical protein ANCCAN_20134 [Ancylostoma caninum]|uniref:Uncharacterized protein n=1 Tax=Ancylostoma caninum TaxID=29170 RepID=A0A368FRA6_ANCCA|nr:hypothetical protein ANCCAN_20134 [Ancylostoma caninum]
MGHHQRGLPRCYITAVAGTSTVHLVKSSRAFSYSNYLMFCPAQHTCSPQIWAIACRGPQNDRQGLVLYLRNVEIKKLSTLWKCLYVNRK